MKKLKVVLTGGPCGGKTTAIQTIEEEFLEKGYQVLIVPEAATILISSGIKPFGDNKISMVEFQKYVMDLQEFLEEVAERAAERSDKDVIIVCDRGLMDDKAYVSEKEFVELLNERGTFQFELMNRYDLVLHLKSAACGKEEFYTLDNNAARTESPAEAREKDKKTLNAWLGHDSLKVIGNDVDFKTKINNCVKEIYNVLEKAYPVQCQEKYLIEKFDVSELEKLQPVVFDIEQYAVFDETIEILYRKTMTEYETKYTAIIKIDTDVNNERIVKRKNISEAEYYRCIPKNFLPIKKKRYCFEYMNQYFRLDVFGDDLKILEIEDTVQTKERSVPSFIEVIDNVTDNTFYRNSALYLNKNIVPCEIVKKN